MRFVTCLFDVSGSQTIISITQPLTSMSAGKEAHGNADRE